VNFIIVEFFIDVNIQIIFGILLTPHAEVLHILNVLVDKMLRQVQFLFKINVNYLNLSSRL